MGFQKYLRSENATSILLTFSTELCLEILCVSVGVTSPVNSNENLNKECNISLTDVRFYSLPIECIGNKQHGIIYYATHEICILIMALQLMR